MDEFIDFQKAFYSPKRRELMSALEELEAKPKSRKLIRMTMRRTKFGITPKLKRIT